MKPRYKVALTVRENEPSVYGSEYIRRRCPNCGRFVEFDANGYYDTAERGAGHPRGNSAVLGPGALLSVVHLGFDPRYEHGRHAGGIPPCADRARGGEYSLGMDRR